MSHTDANTSPEAASDAGAFALLTISHEFGMDTSVHDSRKAAEAALLEYVRSWWADEVRNDDVPMPGDPMKAIDDYFMVHATYENYEITAPDYTEDSVPEVQEATTPEEGEVMATREEALASIQEALREQADKVCAMPHNGVVLRESAPIIDSLTQAYLALKSDATEPAPAPSDVPAP